MTSQRRAMLALLLASAALHVALVWSGGQFYWPDEHRYEEARSIVAEITRGQGARALARLDTAEHLFFKILALVPAAIESMAGEDPRIPGLFFSIFPVINIGLAFLVARRMGASDRESAIAGFLLAISNAFFYYARHLLPYDAAMTWALAALYFAVRDGRIRSSVACGALAACAFLTYAGYWTMAAAAMLLHVIDGARAREALHRAAWAGLGAGATLGAVLATNALAGGHLVARFLAFAGTINQGAFEEGWRLPFEYLWHAEHATLLVWIAATAYWVARLPRALESRQVKLALAGLAFVYACLAITSTALHVFVVYGRLARQLVPFFCLLAAAGLEAMLASSMVGMRRFAPATVALLAAQAAVNFWMDLRVTFPTQFLREADAARLNEVANAAVVNARHLWPLPGRFTLPPGYTVLKEAPHPLQFLPYQYEGYDPAQRQALRAMDIRMLVIAPAR
jgi:hypothetical protein